MQCEGDYRIEGEPYAAAPKLLFHDVRPGLAHDQCEREYLGDALDGEGIVRAGCLDHLAFRRHHRDAEMALRDILPIDALTGLEQGLIHSMRPSWNARGLACSLRSIWNERRLGEPIL